MPNEDSRKVFDFAIEVDGVDALEIQDVKRPIATLGVVKHGGARNTDIKTPGGLDYSDAELKKLKPSTGADRQFLDWLLSAANGLSARAKRDIIFKERNPDGTTASIEIWIGCFPTKVDASNYKRGNQSEAVIDTITLSVDDVQYI